MTFLLAMFAAGALVAPTVMRRAGRNGFLFAAILPALAFTWITSRGSAILAGHTPHEHLEWIPSLGLVVDFRLDALAWLMSLLVSGIGVLVLIYSSRYFSHSATGMGKFAGIFLAFSGSMLGLVTTDNLLVLYTMWELTTVFSFLLIGHYWDRRASRRAAMEAIMVTTLGGLSMLAGLIMLGQLPGGSYRISELINAATSGTLFTPAAHTASTTTVTHPTIYLSCAIGLVVVGALSKSAIVPFHFWLPAAMAAPTPVSAYLHAAAMVKAGVYLVLRLAPGFADLAAWKWTLLPLGAATMIVGGYRALRQYDTKLILAYGTVSQLGFLTFLSGFGRADVALAALALLIAHALFKACLFLTVGIVDWSTGTRDLRELSGVGKRRPVLATCAAISVASMSGIPPFAGYVGKEAALHALTHHGRLGWILVAVIAVGSALTLAYGLRMWWGCFATKPGVADTEVKNRSHLIMVAPIILAAASLILGLVPRMWEAAIHPYARMLPGEDGHLTLWGGWGAPLAITVTVIAAGAALFALRRPVAAVQRSLAFPTSAEGTYRRFLTAVERASDAITSRIQSGSQPAYLAITLIVAVTAGSAAFIFGHTAVTPNLRLVDTWGQLPVAVVTAAAAVMAARARHRLKAVLLMGMSGYGVALLYELHGAPDLALTQVLVETITLVVFVLVLRRLPAYFSNRPLRAGRWLRMILGLSFGVFVATGAVLAAAARTTRPISTHFAKEGYAYGYGRNIVNVTLVDIRAWDTMGEISVIVVCAIGVASLLFIRDRAGRIDSLRNLPRASKRGSVWRRVDETSQPCTTLPAPEYERDRGEVREPGRNLRWLAGSVTLAPERRSLIMEIGTRTVYHTMLVVSLFFLFSGHNQPGGGFAGGLLVGIALTVRYLAGGRYELGAAAPIHPGYVMGTGMVIATTAALVPVLVGGTTLQTTLIDWEMPIFGHVHFATALIFDIGVYLIVVGLSLDILRSLGAEIDRHGELEGVR